MGLGGLQRDDHGPKDDPHLNIVVSHAQGNLVTLWAIALQVTCQVLFIQAKIDSPAPHAA